jgi:hypothetical protein
MADDKGFHLRRRNKTAPVSPPDTDPPVPSYIPDAAEFNKNKDIIYARIQYRKDRSNYYVEQWRDGKLNVDDLAVNTEQGVSFSKPK